MTSVLTTPNIREPEPVVNDDTLGFTLKHENDIEAVSVGPLEARLKYLRGRGPRGARRRN